MAVAVVGYGAVVVTHRSSITQHSRMALLHKDSLQATVGSQKQRPSLSLGAGRRGGAGGAVTARMGDGKEVIERTLGAVGYVLPLLDGMQYGRYVFAQYPASEALFSPLFPLLRIYSSIPFSNFVLFFTLYLTLVRNPSFGRFVRFNAMQACVLDVLIVLPIIAQRILSPRSGLGLDLLIAFYNTLFIALLAAVVFAVVSCLLGKILRLPIVADAADNQLF